LQVLTIGVLDFSAGLWYYINVRLVANTLCRTRYKIQIKTGKVLRRNKANIFFLCIIAIAVAAIKTIGR